jgi:hypothetical protein
VLFEQVFGPYVVYITPTGTHVDSTHISTAGKRVVNAF